MAERKYQNGQKVRVKWMNVFLTGTIRAFNSHANFYDVHIDSYRIDSYRNEVIYTARELDQWNSGETWLQL